MKKRRIVIIAISAVLCLSVGICVFQAAKANKDVKETESISSVSALSEQDAESTSSQESREADAAAENTSAGENSKATEKTEKNNNPKGGEGSPSNSVKTTSRQENNNQPEQQETLAQEQKEPETFKVSISITCHNAVSYGADVPQSGYILTSTSCTVTEGDTVFDVLSAACAENDISLKYQRKTYIQGIGGLNEKDCGDGSGWMYRVNGSAPNKAASKYVLSKGDVIEWYYVTSPSDK